MKMLKVRPSMRLHRRYLLISAQGKTEVEKAILDYIGILGWARASPIFVENSGKDIVLAIARESINDVRAAFELSKENIRVLRVSGTLKGLGR